MVFQIAVDDFGTQASTEQRGRHINPHIIRWIALSCWILNRATQVKWSWFSDLANQIGAKTVIEGIETQQQLAAMQKLRLRYVSRLSLGDAKADWIESPASQSKLPPILYSLIPQEASTPLVSGFYTYNARWRYSLLARSCIAKSHP